MSKQKNEVLKNWQYRRQEIDLAVTGLEGKSLRQCGTLTTAKK